MELRHLRYFVAVAEEGSVTRAARRLKIQQPPLGQQIRALEEELGVRLFDRAPRRISLNAAGKVFLDDAVKVLAQVDEVVDHVRRFDRGERGRLTVGLTSSASLHYLTPRLLRAFHQAFPLVEIEVEEREPYELILGLQKKRIDAAFLHIDVKAFPGLTATVLTREPMVAAIPVDHPLSKGARRVPLSLKMMAEQDFVVYRRPDAPSVFDFILRAFDAAGIAPRIVDQVHRLVAAINLVAAGRGISLVPSSIQVLHREAITYRPVAKSALPLLPFYLIHRRQNNLKLIDNFISVTQSCVAAKRKPDRRAP